MVPPWVVAVFRFARGFFHNHIKIFPFLPGTAGGGLCDLCGKGVYRRVSQNRRAFSTALTLDVNNMCPAPPSRASERGAEWFDRWQQVGGRRSTYVAPWWYVAAFFGLQLSEDPTLQRS